MLLENLEPAERVGLARNAYVFAALVAVGQDFGQLAILLGSYLFDDGFRLAWTAYGNLPLTLVMVVVSVALELTVLAWLSRLLSRGNRVAIMVQILLAPLGLGLMVEAFVNADDQINELFNLVLFTQLSSVATGLAVIGIAWANVSILRKLRSGELWVGGSELRTCRSCGTRNRIPHARLGDRPKCGTCGSRLA